MHVETDKLFRLARGRLPGNRMHALTAETGRERERAGDPSLGGGGGAWREQKMERKGRQRGGEGSENGGSKRWKGRGDKEEGREVRMEGVGA